MNGNRYYVTNPADPAAPVALSEYRGIHPGDTVTCDTAPLRPLPGPLTVDAFYEFRDIGDGGWVTAILNDGKWEVNADSLQHSHLWPCCCLINDGGAHRVGCPEHPEGIRGR